MTRLFLLCFVCACTVFGQVATEVADLAWMAGDWGPAGQSAVASEEHWIAPAGGMMLGVSRTIARGRVVEFEFLRIEKRADGVYYVAQPGGKPPVAFKMTASTKDSVTFENPAHDFPKLIGYRQEGETGLVAVVEGDEGGKHKKLEFRFVRVAGK